MSKRQQPDMARLQQVNTLLEQALTLPEEEREAWLQALSQEHRALAPLLRAMLQRASVETDRFMRRSVTFMRGAADDEGAADAPDDTVGPYRLIAELGHGGMGTVWLAERTDGTLQRQVALKLPRHTWALGLAQRMARERDILSALEHPGIARLYDAGTTDSGRPWLAMERVDGVPIDEYCRDQQLDVPQRLGLFLQVAEAVAHAHARLIVHRDLKPNNILVTAQGQARLLDFGVAKLLEEDPAQGQDLTQQLGRAVTLDYASPEQVGLGAVTVATDVYSLGVVLYELLTGERPYRLGRPSAAALEEAILHSDAPAASARVSGKLARRLRGDIDTIVGKALQKDPSRRYASVESMAADIRRHLDGLPVLARPPSWRYRSTKFVSRHRLALAATGGVMASLLLGLGAALWQAQEARGQAERAQVQAQRAQAVQDVLLSIFKANSLQQPDPVRARQTTARDLLDIGAETAVRSLGGAPEAQDAVLDTLADMYYQLDLGEQAARMRGARVAALKKAHGELDPRVARALLSYADDVAGTEEPLRAVPALAEARRILDHANDHTSPARGWSWLASSRLQQYLSIAQAQRDADAALRHFEQHPGAWTDRFHALQAVARAQFVAGDFTAAASTHRLALEQVKQHVSGPTVWSVTPTVQLAESQLNLLDYDGAEQNLRAALTLSRRLSGDESTGTLQTQAKLGDFLYKTGRREEGQRLVADAQTVIDRQGPRASQDAIDTVGRMRALQALSQGQLAAAEPILAKLVAELRRQLPGSLPLARTLLLHASALTAMGRHDAAGAALDDAWQLWQTVAGEFAESPLSHRFRLERARWHLARGDVPAAQRELAVVSAARPATALAATARPLDVDGVQAQVLLAQAHLLQQQPNEAERLASSALDALRRSPLRERFPALEAEASLRAGQALQRSGRAQAARVELERAVLLRQAEQLEQGPALAEARIALAESLLDVGDRPAAITLHERARTALTAHAELSNGYRAPLALLETRLRGAPAAPAPTR